MSLVLKPTGDLVGAKLITLAGTKYPIPPLPLRQMLALGRQLPKLAELTRRGAVIGATVVGDNKMSSEATIEFASMALDLTEIWIEVVRIGLSVAHPDVTVDDILALRTNPKELGEAGDVIVGLGGATSAVAAGEQPAASA